ncbi:hypothetical protein HYI16_17170 [Clostridium botulinum]|uniref:hypothetical protein n=1 Tax=Clostridium botulinum TaxID=1491 RepID=UPI001C9B3D42|nr:hypothetical protein [Clostridium botulinum]MBY7043772.1 hypothetical protein [Clostridium botulinum]
MLELNYKCPKCDYSIDNDGEEVHQNKLLVKGYCYNCKTYYDLEYKMSFELIKFEEDKEV